MRALRLLWLGSLLLAASMPSPALAKDVSPAMIAARSHFFGDENVDQKKGEVDKDKVILSWFSVQSYAAAVRGRVFLMDSYIYRVADKPAYVPTTVQELVDLQPEAIFIGHGHGDHADNAAYIAMKTGATIFGAAEHCVAMQADAVKIFGPGSEVKCVALTTTGSDPGAEVMQIGVLKPDVCITSFKHVHSATVLLDPDFPPNPINPVRDPRVDQLFPPQPPPALDTRTTGVGGGGTVSMFYHFTVKDTGFSFVWHDTAGPLKERAPQVLDMLRALPKVDVELGAIVSIGEAVNGVRDIGMYVEAIQPKIFYAGHSDNFNIGSSVYYQNALRRQFDIFHIPADLRPEIRGMHDPYDYVRPGLATFDDKDKVWKERPAGKGNPTCRF